MLEAEFSVVKPTSHMDHVSSLLASVVLLPLPCLPEQLLDGITADKDPLELGSPARGQKYWRRDIGTRVEEGWQGRWQEGWQEGWEKTPKRSAKAGNSITTQAYTKHIHV